MQEYGLFYRLRILVILLTSFLSLPVQAEVYKCEVNYKIVYQQVPCVSGGTTLDVSPAKGKLYNQNTLTKSEIVGDRKLIIKYDYNTLYVDKNNNAGESSLFFYIYLLKDGKRISDTESFFKINGISQRITSRSDNKLVINKKSTFTYVPVSSGDANIIFSLAGKKITIPIKVEKLPVAINESADHVIKKLGIPERKSKIIISWPNSERVHGVMYSDRLDYNFCSYTAEHWGWFNKYPGAFVSLCNSKIVTIGSISPTKKWKENY